MDSVAYFTYIVTFLDLKFVPFMAYTYNIQGRGDETIRLPDDADAREGIKNFNL